MRGKAPAIHGVRSRGPRSNSTAGGSMSANRAVTRPIRRALDLVDDDEPPQGFEGELRLLQQREVAGILQIEKVICAEARREGRLARLA